MVIVIVTAIVSFFLESIVSNFVALDSQLWIPLFSLVSLIIIYPYFKGQEQNYLKVCALIGFCYDIVFTDTLLMNFVIFIGIGVLIQGINHIFSTNMINICFMVPVIVALYRLVSYLILCLAGFFHFEWQSLGVSIYSSLLLNIMYAVIVYLITDRIAKRYRIYKVD